MRSFHCIVAAALCTALSGCITYSLTELRNTTPQGNAFQNALAKHYLRFAESEEKEYDWSDSMYFADKGLLAAYGKETAPEDLEVWKIIGDFLPQMLKAREELVAVLTPETTAAKPELSADAQFFFDCWVEQQEEGWQTADIEHCRDGFNEAMKQLEHAVKETALDEEESAGKDLSTMVEPNEQSYVVFFEEGKSSLSASGNITLERAVNNLENKSDYEIVLNGHTDREGHATSNLKLARDRAEAVKKHLVDAGLKSESIKTIAYGETDPKIKTAGKTKEPANRRVEIFIQQAAAKQADTPAEPESPEAVDTQSEKE